MNAIVGLSHFCEAHGPRPLFCTFTTDNERNTTESSKVSVQCNGCTSLGPETVLVSKDSDGTIFCSRESVPNADITTFLRQAAIRSITCEVCWSKEGGVVYFSDAQGHVLSLTFQLRDTRARGLKRWFSIIVLMKDKMLLLNITPLLSEQMQKIANELQQLADVVYDEEQKACSQRSLRLKTGRNDFGQSRSLVQLTGNENIFKTLHSHFTWMLKAGAHTYSETLYTSQDMLYKLQPQMTKSTMFESNTACIMPSDKCISLRELEKQISGEVFKVLSYCTLTGITTKINSEQLESLGVVKCLSRLLPITEDIISHINTNNVIDTPECLIEEISCLDFRYTWTQTLPNKCPTLMTRIENAMNNSKFNEAVLNQHVKSLVLEWLGIAKAVKSAIESSGQQSETIIKLKQILGVTQHDDKLLNYWMKSFC